MPHKPEKKASLAAGLEVKQFGMQLEEQVQTELDAAASYAILEGIDLTRTGAIAEVIAKGRRIGKDDVVNQPIGNAAVLPVEDVKHRHSELHGHAFAYPRVLEEAHAGVVDGLTAQTRVTSYPKEWITEEGSGIRVVVDPMNRSCCNRRAS